MRKVVVIDEATHYALKVEASKRGLTMSVLVAELAKVANDG